jgi:endonuclease/exonuclease/phosphatase family metal-dependent hydrolase
VRVVTWNLWWRFGPWHERQAAIEHVLADVDADVVLLQETWIESGLASQAARLGDGLGLHAVPADVPLRDGAAMGNAVLSRWPVVANETVPLPRADGSPGHRHALWCSLHTPAGRVGVVSTHLEYPFDDSATRQRQVAALCRLVVERRGDPATAFPTIVGGDLNAVPDSDEVRSLTGRRVPPEPGLVFTDAWDAVGEGPGWTWDAANPYLATSAWPRRRLDYVLVSWPRPKPVGNPVRCRLAGREPIDGVQPSDHYAVVADLVDGPVTGSAADAPDSRGTPG